MKTRKLFNLIGILALVAVIGMAACSSGGGGGGGGRSSGGSSSGGNNEEPTTPTNQTPVAGDYTIGNLNQTAGSVTAVTITPQNGKSSGARTIKYSGNTTIPQTAGTYPVTFDVAAATGWNAATNLSAGTLTVTAVGDTTQTPVASDYTIGNLDQTIGSVTSVSIAPKSGKSSGVRTIYYNGVTALPSNAGIYAVTFDVAAVTGWRAATGLVAGNLAITPPTGDQKTVTVLGATFDLIWINAGTFTMGSPTSEPNRKSNETPQHSVTLTQGFYIGKYMVTQDQYHKVMESKTGYFKQNYFYNNPAAGEEQGKRPVEMVTWFEAIEFCNELSILENLTPVYTINNRLPLTGYPLTGIRQDDNNIITIVTTVTPNWNANGYRLPTEAQWEYACRAGTITAYNLGSTWNDNWGWVYSNSNDMTHEVGKKTANEWGLYDMHGNVSEWCWDLYGDYASGSQIDPRGASTGNRRVVRGGYFKDGAENARSAFRGTDFPYARELNSGFRVIRPL